MNVRMANSNAFPYLSMNFTETCFLSDNFHLSVFSKSDKCAFLASEFVRNCLN